MIGKTIVSESSSRGVCDESFSKNIEIQLSHVFKISKPVLEIMKKQKSGSVVNIASIYGMVGNDFTVYKGTNINAPVAYSAIKGDQQIHNLYFLFQNILFRN